MTDEYRTIAAPTTGEYKEKASKFLAYSYEVATEQAVKDLVDALKKAHPKARHWCYAYRLGLDKHHYRANDDGEPAGSAGRPILGQLDSYGFTNVLVVVVRYFGGTKLGIPGLIHAYKTAAAEALAQAVPVLKTVNTITHIAFPYTQMGNVMNFIKKENIVIASQTFGEEVVLEITIRKAWSAEKIAALLQHCPQASIKSGQS